MKNGPIPIPPKLQAKIDQIRGERVPGPAPFNDSSQTADAIAQMKDEKRAVAHAANVRFANEVAGLSDAQKERLGNLLLDDVASRRPSFERSVQRGLRRGSAPIEKRHR